MKTSCLCALLGLIATLPLTGAEIRRYSFGEWSERIGYSEAVAVDHTLYFSGIVAEADTMEACLADVLGQAEIMLRRFGLSRDQVLKEKIYTNDKTAVRRATGLRKDFYGENRPVAVWIETGAHARAAWIEMELIVHIPDGHPLPEPQRFKLSAND